MIPVLSVGWDCWDAKFALAGDEPNGRTLHNSLDSLLCYGRRGPLGYLNCAPLVSG